MTEAWLRREATAAWIRGGATALAGARTAIGVVALASPMLIARPWVGAGAAKAAPGRVLGRALGGRDLALGLGALIALRRARAGGQYGAGVWVGVAALADSFDVLATGAAWDELPAVTRWLVAGSAAGSAAVGAVAAWSLIKGDPAATGPA
jgi:hypothetical protein